MASQTKTPSGEESTLGSGTPDRAAWYPDPRGQGKLRWWDGSQWTENVHGTPAPEPETNRNGPDGEQPTDEVANVASEKLKGMLGLTSVSYVERPGALAVVDSTLE